MKPSLLLGLAVLLLIGSGSFFKVDESNVAIRFQFGGVVETDIGPGLHFKVPLVQTVLAFDRRILSLDSQPERYLTFEKKDVNVRFLREGGHSKHNDLPDMYLQARTGSVD